MKDDRPTFTPRSFLPAACNRKIKQNLFWPRSTTLSRSRSLRVLYPSLAFCSSRRGRRSR